MDIIYRGSISPEEGNSLRASIGFRQMEPAQLSAGLDGSRRIVAAYERDRAVGMGFQVSTPERQGVPMHICLTDQIERTDAKFKQCDYKE